MVLKLKDLTREDKVLLILGKDVLTIDEASIFLGISKSTLWKYTSQNKIPHYKSGKRLYFKKSELEEWMLSNKVKTLDEIEAEALAIVHLKKSRGNGKK